MVRYGADTIGNAPDAGLIEEFGLRPGDYYLRVCRLEPENHVREIVDGFSASATARKLIVVRDHQSGTEYVQSMLLNKDPRIHFVGTIFDPY